MGTRAYTYPEAVDIFSRKAAGAALKTYRRYGVEYEDLEQEIMLWVYGPGSAKIRRWLASDPQQTTRIYMSMRDVARAYAEQEKAIVCGYKVEDLYWYSPDTVLSVLALARNDDWDGLAAEHGNGLVASKQNQDLLAMVMDVRRALKAGCVGVDSIIEYLGSNRPEFVGSRRVISNATAQSITE